MNSLSAAIAVFDKALVGLTKKIPNAERAVSLIEQPELAVEPHPFQGKENEKGIHLEYSDTGYYHQFRWHRIVGGALIKYAPEKFVGKVTVGFVVNVLHNELEYQFGDGQKKSWKQRAPLLDAVSSASAPWYGPEPMQQILDHQPNLPDPIVLNFIDEPSYSYQQFQNGDHRAPELRFYSHTIAWGIWVVARYTSGSQKHDVWDVLAGYRVGMSHRVDIVQTVAQQRAAGAMPPIPVIDWKEGLPTKSAISDTPLLVTSDGKVANEVLREDMPKEIIGGLTRR